MEMRERNADFAIGPAMVPTDIGLLPKDWQAIELGKVSSCLIGLTYSPADVREYGVLVLRSSNIQRRRLDYSDCVYVDMDIPPRAIAREGDVLVCVRNGSRELIGKAALIDVQAAGSAFGAFMAVLRSGEGRYLHYVVDSSTFRRQTEQRLGATINQITNRDMAAYVIPWPQSLGERDAIAEALSDADALIESLSLLLAKKRQIKQGAMQELLTGEKRLPGFDRPWTSQRLSELGAFLKGRGVTRDQARSGNLPCVRYGEIYTHHHEVIQRYESWISPAVASGATRLRRGDILFAGSGETKEEIGKCTAFVSSDQAYAGGDIVILRTRGACATFLSYLLNTPRIQAMKTSRGQGDAVVHISSAALARIEVLVPDRDEQTAIADVLAEMDNGIVFLQAKLDTVRDIKQGMMQALLTGRIRLMQPTSNVVPLPTRPAATKPPSTQPTHNWQVNEAVVIGVLAQRFGDERYPLPRKRRVKLMYLLHRHAEEPTDRYLKKAAGPYDPGVKYSGPEKIALKNGYVRALRNDKYEGFVAGDKIQQAQRYFEQWYGVAALDWLERFHYRKTDELELLATVDMAMMDLATNGETADVASVKRVIATDPEWLPKLSRELFSDERIAAAIAECQALFGG